VRESNVCGGCFLLVGKQASLMGPHAFLIMKHAYAGANSRSVMPLNVLGSTRTTLVW